MLMVIDLSYSFVNMAKNALAYALQRKSALAF
jgi:hypothetical protein